MIWEALARTSGNKTEAAKLLRGSRDARLYSRLKSIENDAEAEENPSDADQTKRRPDHHDRHQDPDPLFHKSHPWHGISVGDHCPEIVSSFIEMVPTDTVKYEVDKRSGHLKLDRPQKYSSQCPAPIRFHSADLLRNPVWQLRRGQNGTQ